MEVVEPTNANNEQVDNAAPEESNQEQDNGLSALQAQLADERAQREALNNKVQELIGEKRTKQEAERQAQLERAQALEEKARQEDNAGKLKELLDSAKEETNKYKKELEERDKKIEEGIKRNAAMEVANQVAANPANAEILADLLLLKNRVGVMDGKAVVNDADGRATVSALADLASQIESDDRYASLVKGNQASGGGATGSGGRAPTKSNELTGEQLESMTMVERERYFANQRK